MKVGIDLGTTFSLVARMGPTGQPVLLPDASDRGAFHTPSVVHVSGESAFVGQMAEDLLEQDPSLKVIRFFKRQFGTGQPIYFDEQGNAWHPEAVAALVLKKLCFDAESHAATPVASAVITVPAHFNDPQRKSVLSAALLADIPVLGLVEEPVAAALHYGVTHAAHEQVLLVYDFGGGTFDATALSLDPNGVYVLAKTGLTDLGGKEFDEAIGSMILEQYDRSTGSPLPLNARVLLELRRVSEQIKIELCLPNQPAVRRMILLGGRPIEVHIRREEFEGAIREHLDRAEACTLECVREAGLEPRDVHAVLLVGGTSMAPVIRGRMQRIFGGAEQRVFYHEPSKAVAYGAVVHASQLGGEAAAYQIPPEFRGVSGYSVGVRAMDSGTGRVKVDTLIKKNLPLPIKVRKTYYTVRASQERIVLDFVQYREPGEAHVPLGQLVVGPLPSPRQNYPVEVTVEYREDGTVQVQAYDAETGVELAQVFGRDADGGIGQLAVQRALVRSTLINNA